MVCHPKKFCDKCFRAICLQWLTFLFKVIDSKWHTHTHTYTHVRPVNYTRDHHPECKLTVLPRNECV